MVYTHPIKGKGCQITFLKNQIQTYASCKRSSLNVRHKLHVKRHLKKVKDTNINHKKSQAAIICTRHTEFQDKGYHQK